MKSRPNTTMQLSTAADAPVGFLPDSRKTPCRCVILAQSARMLAQSATRCGWQAWVLDLYGDRDTQAASEHSRVVVDADGGFDRERILTEIRLALTNGASGLVYAGDLECHADLLDDLARWIPIWGNPATTVRYLKTPRRFFALLDSLEIPYPETRFTPPTDASGWLIKPACGAGGKGVAFSAFFTATPCGAYFQRQLAGTPMSVLFLADGRRAQPIGFNALWVSGTAAQPFRFVGAHNRPALPTFWRKQLAEWLQRLVGSSELRGLNSLDFIFDGKRCWVLEINPRPSATLALYDEDFVDGLLAAHVDACNGRLPETIPVTSPRALRIVFAQQRLNIPPDMNWPPWCADLPLADSVLEIGQPLCSVLVAGVEQDLLRLSLEREQLALGLVAP